MPTHLTSAAFDFILGEIEQVHALCDRALMPRKVDGEDLTMAERVNVMEAALRRMVREAGKVDPTVLH